MKWPVKFNTALLISHRSCYRNAKYLWFYLILSVIWNMFVFLSQFITLSFFLHCYFLMQFKQAVLVILLHNCWMIICIIHYKVFSSEFKFSLIAPIASPSLYLLSSTPVFHLMCNQTFIPARDYALHSCISICRIRTLDRNFWGMETCLIIYL